MAKPNCSLKKNKSNPLCKKLSKNNHIGEAIFSIIIPTRDNSGRKIDNKLYQKYIDRVNNKFGGSSTYPSVLGCFKNEQTGRTECEKNVRIDGIRDFESSNQSHLSGISKKKVLEKDFKFMKELAKEMGDDFGQTAMLVIKDDIDDASLILTTRKEKIEEEKIFDNFFDREVN